MYAWPLISISSVLMSVLKQHVVLLHSAPYPCGGATATGRCAAGKRMVKVVPLPSSLATVIVPPSCSTMRLVIARPRPSPRFLVVTKSSKIAPRRSAGMPEPVSAMLTSTSVARVSPSQSSRGRPPALPESRS